MQIAPARLTLTVRLLTLLLTLTFLGCQAPQVTSGGVPVLNQTIVTATQAVHVAEVAAATVADALTAQGGRHE